MSRKQAVRTRPGKKAEVERKRDERAARRAFVKERRHRAGESPDNEEFLGFANQLQVLGLRLREVPGDGNCLFRALGDQLEGHSQNHLKHRQETVDYMVKNRNDFEPFVEDDIPFDRHVQNLSQPGTFAGNDAIVAFARNNQVNVVIHQLNNPLWQKPPPVLVFAGQASVSNKDQYCDLEGSHGVQMMRVGLQDPQTVTRCLEDIKEIRGTDKPTFRELHIAYRYGEHYDSVRRINDNTETPANLQTEMLSKDESVRKGRQRSDQVDDRSELHGDAVQKVQNATGCADVQLILQNLEAECYNIDSAIHAILQIEELKQFDEYTNCAAEGTSCPFTLASWDANENRKSEELLYKNIEDCSKELSDHTISRKQAKADTERNKEEPSNMLEESKAKRGQAKLSNKQRKEQQRQEKKRRQADRHRQKVQENKGIIADNNRQDTEGDASGVTVIKAFAALNI